MKPSSKNGNRIGAEHIVRNGVQVRGLLLKMKKHFGEFRKALSNVDMVRMLGISGIEVAKGDIVYC